MKIQNLKVVNTREIPGTEVLRKEKPMVFTAKSGFGTTLQQKWNNSISSWLKKNSAIKYRKDYPQIDYDWALEEVFNGIRIVKGNKVELSIIVRLIDTIFQWNGYSRNFRGKDYNNTDKWNIKFWTFQRRYS